MVRQIIPLLAALVVGCGAPQATLSVPDVHVVFAGGGDLSAGVAWLDANELIVSIGTDPGNRLFIVEVGTGAARPFHGPESARVCARTDDLSPSTGSGALIWLHVCVNGPAPRQYDVDRLNPDGSFEVIGSLATPFPVSGLVLDGDVLMTAYGSQFCETMIKIGPTGLEPYAVEVAGPDATYNTGGDVRADCDRMGVTMLPALHGDALAFMASTSALVHDMQARLAQPFDLYLAGVGQSTSTRVPVEIVDPGDLLWLADGGHVLVSGEKPIGTGGTWRVDTTTGAMTLVFPFVARSLSLSPDGTMYAALRSTGAALPAHEVVIFPASVVLP